MKKALLYIAVVLSAFVLVSCEDEQEWMDSSIDMPTQLTLPREGYESDLSLGLDVVFEWEASEGYAKYQILFASEDGSFSSPLYSALSDDSGFTPSATVAYTTLNTIAVKAGCSAGESVTVKWTIMVYKYTQTEILSDYRTIVLTRANTLETNPTTLSLYGDASEAPEDGVPMNLALDISSTTGAYTDEILENVFECFTKIGAGNYTIIDDLGRWFSLNDDGTITCSEDEEVTNTNDEEGIYLLTMNFNTMKWSTKEIDYVTIWTYPWMYSESTEVELDYVGLGQWNITDYAWDVGTASSHDTRYHFICYYADGSEERWSYWDDDCRNNAAPDADAIFYNVYRFDNTTLDSVWDHSWKTLSDSEGIGMLATFDVYMNNTYADNYIHTRSFADNTDNDSELETPSAMYIGGSAAESSAVPMNLALEVGTTTGSTKYDRLENVYECFTKLTADSFTIYDDCGQYYQLNSDGSLTGSAYTAYTNTNSSEGIYLVTINIAEMTWSMNEITGVYLRNVPWFSDTVDKELEYNGLGEWYVSNYAWYIGTTSQHDSRHCFIATFADGTTERWSYWDDDCRVYDSDGPDGDSNFYNVYRFTDSTLSDKWVHTWKTDEANGEGIDQLVSFHLYMNNTQADDYSFTRTIKDAGGATELYVGGSAAESSSVPMYLAPVLSSEGSYNDNRQTDVFECFTKLSAGSYTVTDEYGRYYTLSSDGSVSFGFTEATNTNDTEGVYLLTVNLDQNTWSALEVSAVYLWTHPWWSSQNVKKEMTYSSLGEWYIKDYEWYIGDDENTHDSRYVFYTEFADGTTEYWGHFESNCNGEDPSSYSNFYTVYRYSSMSSEWNHNWKTYNDYEGLGQLAEFHLYMNNTQASDYTHTRSFTDK